MANDRSETALDEDNAQPLPRRLGEAVAAYLLDHPRGYELPPLDIIVRQMSAALAAADAVDPMRKGFTNDE